MGSRFEVQRIENGEVVSEGVGECVNVIRYEGEGIYLAEFIFDADPTGTPRATRFDIDIKKHLMQLHQVQNPPPPPVEPARRGIFGIFQTQDAAKRKGGKHG